MIPKIIHQLWEGEPLYEFYSKLAETWKEQHPDWKYEFWDGDRMRTFVQRHFPQFVDAYIGLKYDIQRWDAVRYMILYKIGGMYMDFDYECLSPADEYLAEEGKCYFALEPEEHCIYLFGRDTFSNALMATYPGHPFFKKILDHIFVESHFEYTNHIGRDVHASTGPMMLTELYQHYPNKDEIVLWPAKLAMPWTNADVRSFMNGTADESYLEKKLEKAFAVHYFFSTWAR